MSGENQVYSWKDYTATVNGRTLIGIDSIDCDIEKKVESVYGKGDTPIGFGTGNKKSSGKLTITEEEYAVLQKAAVDAGLNDLTDLPPFPIVGLLEKKNGEKIKTKYPAVKIKKVGMKKKQDDTKFTRDIDFENLVMPVETPIGV
ncbi:MAG TPA: hypothetical protein PK573_07780 [Spirochaetota bacterium]|nr:hypothetical protein [Spirochaetota bacterium]HRZ27135.1 hypothetical protein [Spirochaetota bacterium]HSA14991.1 hypothetical protein [Spirochaetota bacterium]